MCTGAVGRAAIPCRWRGRLAAGAVLQSINLWPLGRGASAARVEHENWRVVGMYLVSFQHFLADAADDGVKQRGFLTDPARQRRSVNV